MDVPGATPSHLVVQMGKDGYAYLLNRDNLGGITAPIAEARVGLQLSYMAGRPLTELTKARMLLFAPAAIHSTLSALLQPVHLPSSAYGVCSGQHGCGSPWVTSTDGTNNMIVWVVGTGNPGTGGDQRLHGYDGDTGAVVYAGGGANELMAGTHT